MRVNTWIPPSSSTVTAQRGSALVTGLVFLVIIIMLGLSASSGAIQQELAARNQRDQTIAMEATDAALRAAETWLRTTQGAPKPLEVDPLNGTALVKIAGFCDIKVNNCVKAGATFWNANGEPLAGPALQQASEQPRYIIEYVPETLLGQEPIDYYRITARGVGMNAKTDRIILSIYRY